jgi:hypothetical protein
MTFARATAWLTPFGTRTNLRPAANAAGHHGSAAHDTPHAADREICHYHLDLRIDILSTLSRRPSCRSGLYAIRVLFLPR